MGGQQQAVEDVEALRVALALGPGHDVAGAQQGEPALADDDAITFRHVGVEQGLPSSVVLDVTQDALGFVWIATDEGLVRYDGMDRVTYQRTADSTSLAGNVVQGALEKCAAWQQNHPQVLKGGASAEREAPAEPNHAEGESEG